MSRLVHIGVIRRSGRYPWGSGGETATATELLSMINRLAAKGLSQKEIAVGLNIHMPGQKPSTGALRNQKSLAKSEVKEAARLNVIRQREGGMSVAAISREFGIPAGTIRDMLQPSYNIKFKIVHQIANKLRETILKSKKLTKGKFGFVDVGEGTEIFINVPRTKFDNATTLLQNEGYSTHYLRQEQLGTGKKTSLKILGTPGATYNDMIASKANISIPDFFTEDSGLTFYQPDEINNFSSSRVLVRYKDTGGGAKDGLIEMRRGVPELSLGDKAYAQVRIGVDDTHFMKGMAVLRDDIPKGYDIIYNTSKLNTGNKLDAMKPQIEVGASKFGALVKPNAFQKDGKDAFGVVNIVGDTDSLAVEGAWAGWRRNLASQILSKQSPRLSTKQLDVTYKNSLAELSDIMELTNPTVRNHLLIDFADKADKASVDLKAAALPRQTTNVLLPDPNMKPNEVYAPNYDNGETVVLLRYPHGGIFEIPTLTVNNKYSEYRDIIGKTAKDAVAVHPDVAHKLSGADFDGDFVLVVPNKKKQIRTEATLETLKTFDARSAYPKYPGMKVMTEPQKERQMGNISNLITDMTIKGAPQSEIARAVKHSMVVIDAANHELNYTQSRLDNGIAALKTKYQGSARSGASTLISRAKSEERVPQRRDHYTINDKTGEKIHSYTYETYIHPKTGKEIPLTTRSRKMAETKDGYDLSSGTVIEGVYANHANNMKNLGNQARLATLSKEPTPYSSKARATYLPEVTSLDKQYKLAVRHRPIERKAQILGGEIYKAKVEANPGMSRPEKKTAKGQSLVLARVRLGATKPVINITPREWEAIEMGAVSQTRLKGILRNADMDVVRTYATPRAVRGGLSTAKTSRAKALIKAGYTAAEIASAIGVPVSQIRTIDKD